MHGGLRTTGAPLRSSTPEAPLVSIITVVLNGAAHLEQAMASVFAQTYPHVEYLVVDGGSTDGTLDIVRGHEDRIDYWVSEPDRGIYHGMNKGLALARGDLVGLLNADDFYEPEALERVAARYLENRVPGIYYGDNLVLHDDLQLRYRRQASLRCWLGMSICHQAMFVHRETYRRLGGYAEEFRFAADYDFLLRAVAAQVPLVHVPSVLVTYRETGLTSRHYRASLGEAKRINRDHFGPFSRKHRAYLRGYFRTLVLHGVQQAVLKVFGRQALDRLRNLYLRRVLVKTEDMVPERGGSREAAKHPK